VLLGQSGDPGREYVPLQLRREEGHLIDDERPLIDFENPKVLSEVFRGGSIAAPEMRRCSECGSGPRDVPASALTWIKHRHGSQPLGHMRLYCDAHLAHANEWDNEQSPRSEKTGTIYPPHAS